MIIANNICKTFNPGHQNQYSALKHITFNIEDNDFVVITGESGAGKSTLLHILSGIDTFESGSIWIDGKQLENLKDHELAALRNELFGIVVQDYALLDEFTVLENVMLPLNFSIKQHNRRSKIEMAQRALIKVGLHDVFSKQVRHLSGGQKQRVAIARAIVNNPKYIFADEPTGSLDSENSNNILQLFHKLNRDGICIIIITHNCHIAEDCSLHISIHDGMINQICRR